MNSLVKSGFTHPAQYQYFTQLYTQALDSWDIEVSRMMVETRYGRTSVIAAGVENPGNPVVFLHGFDATSLMWQGIMTAIALGCPCYAIDILGQLGLSRSNGTAMASSLSYVPWLAQTLNALHISQPIELCGYSYGGNIAAHYAARYREDIASCVLIEPAVVVNIARYDFLLEFMGVRSSRSAFKDMTELIEEKLAWEFYNPLIDPVLIYGMQNFKHGTFTIPVPLAARVSPWKLRQLSKKTTLILAGNSELINPKRAVVVAKGMLPHAQVHVIEHTTHSLTGEKPREIIKLLQARFGIS